MGTRSGLSSVQRGRDFGAVFVREDLGMGVGYITVGIVILEFMLTVSWLKMKGKRKKLNDFSC